MVNKQDKFFNIYPNSEPKSIKGTKLNKIANVEKVSRFPKSIIGPALAALSPMKTLFQKFPTTSQVFGSKVVYPIIIFYFQFSRKNVKITLIKGQEKAYVKLREVYSEVVKLWPKIRKRVDISRVYVHTNGNRYIPRRIDYNHLCRYKLYKFTAIQNLQLTKSTL